MLCPCIGELSKIGEFRHRVAPQHFLLQLELELCGPCPLSPPLSLESLTHSIQIFFS